MLVCEADWILVETDSLHVDEPHFPTGVAEVQTTLVQASASTHGDHSILEVLKHYWELNKGSLPRNDTTCLEVRWKSILGVWATTSSYPQLLSYRL